MTGNHAMINGDQRNHTVAVRAQLIDQRRLEWFRESSLDNITNVQNVRRFFGSYLHYGKPSVSLLL